MSKDYVNSGKSYLTELLVQMEFNEETNKYVCPHCGKEYSKMGIGTHIWRNHTEEGKKFNPNPNKGYYDVTRVAWNKGLTKETDERVRNTLKHIKLGKR